jgi:hypothetical protein
MNRAPPKIPNARERPFGLRDFSRNIFTLRMMHLPGSRARKRRAFSMEHLLFFMTIYEKLVYLHDPSVEKRIRYADVSMFYGILIPSKDWINENYQVDTAAGLEIEG